MTDYIAIFGVTFWKNILSFIVYFYTKRTTHYQTGGRFLIVLLIVLSAIYYYFLCLRKKTGILSNLRSDSKKRNIFTAAFIISVVVDITILLLI